ncbi:MAG: AAA family ATPase, partial [Alphaproteobacteria bacterium]
MVGNDELAAGADGVPPWAPPLVVLRDAAPLYVAAPAEELLHALAARGAHPRYALWCLCEVVESATRFLAVAGLVEAATGNGGRLPGDLAAGLAAAIERPTFGVWRRALVAVATGRSSAAMPEIAAAAAAVDGLCRGTGEDSDIVALRNALAHGIGVSAARAQGLLDLWGPRVAALGRALAWLGELELWTAEPGGARLLRGPSPDGVAAALPDALAGRLAPGDAVLLRAGTTLSLDPLGRRAPVAADGPPVAQVFMRRDPNALIYGLVGSEDALQARSDEAAVRRFVALLDLDALRQRVRDRAAFEPGFEDEVARDAARFVGRADDLEALGREIAVTTAGALWVTGEAGIGKSALLARMAADLAAAGGAAVHTYRFRASGGRDGPLPFHRWLVERLAGEEADAILRTARNEGELRDALLRVLARGARPRTIVFVDGLDEVERRAPGFTADLLSALLPIAHATVFVLAGRPERGLPALMSRLGVTGVMAGGLRPLRRDELRAMIDTRMPVVARRFVRRDLGDGEVRNAVVDRLAERSRGLPIYVEQVLQDIAAGRFRRFDVVDAERLPESIRAYFAELLSRGGLGDVAAFRQLILCFLALAAEPLSTEALAALVRRDFDAGDRQHALTAAAIDELGGMLRVAESVDGTPGWRIFHTELADFVRRADTMAAIRGKAEAVLLAAVASPDAATRGYLLRAGIRHLLEAGRGAEAAALLCDVGYQLGRVAALAPGGGDAGIRSDWDRVVAARVPLSPAAADWQNFWATDGARFFAEPGADGPRDLVECVRTYAPETTVGAAASTIDAAAHPPLIALDGPYRRPGRLVAGFTGHMAAIAGAMELPDGRILSWSADGTLRRWSSSGDAVGEPMRMEGEVAGVIRLADGSILAWANLSPLESARRPDAPRGRFQRWTPAGEALGPPVTVRDRVGGAVELADRRILTLPEPNQLMPEPPMLWSGDGSRLGPVALPSPYVGYSGWARLAAGRTLVWDYARLRVFDGRAEAVGEGSPVAGAFIKGVLALADGRFLTWGNGQPLHLWGADGSPASGPHGSPGERILGVIELPDGRIVSCDFDRWLIWDRDMNQVGEKQGGNLWDPALLPDGTLLCRTIAADYRGILVVVDQALKTVDTFDESFGPGILGAIGLADGRILFWTNRRQLHVWDRTRPSGPTVAQGVWDDVRLTGRRELALWLWRVREAR